MRTEEEIRAELKMLNEQMDGLKLRISAVEQELADSLVKFKVGQRIIETYGLKKTEFEITSVKYWYGKHVFYSGRKVLKSGALHKNVIRIYGDIEAKQVTE